MTKHKRREKRTGPATLAAAACIASSGLAAQEATLATAIQQVEVTGHYDNAVGSSDAASQGVIGAALLKSRPAQRPGEVLEFIPGMIVTQHAGDGKANQYFLRGFNLDHGTDFATRIAGMPVNMPTHAHGQGYTDLNFLLPELVQRIEYRKGPCFAGSGDFASAGAADIVYRTQLDAPFASVTLGENGYRRGVGAGSAEIAPGLSLLGAVELMRNDGPWTVPEDLQRANAVFTLSGGTAAQGFSASLMGYDASWTSTDQSPLREPALEYDCSRPRWQASGQRRQAMAMDVVDYEIKGAEMQFVEVELDPGEAAVGEAGSMMFMDAGIGMDTVFGDGSAQQGGLFGKLLGAGKRLVTGESLFTTVYTNNSGHKRRVAFAAPYPGKILPMDLRQFGGLLICQKDAFLCAARGVSLGIHFQQRLSAGFFGGEGFIMQKLEGDGLAFVHAGGTVERRELQAGQVLFIDTGCVVAFTAGVAFEVQYVGKIKTALFGGEGLFFAKVTGPGTVWLQSLPFSRLASRVFAAAPQTGGGRRDEASLGGLVAGGGLLGGILGGDRDH